MGTTSPHVEKRILALPSFEIDEDPMNLECKIDHMVIRKIYENSFSNGKFPLANLHVIAFEKLCASIKTPNLDPSILKIKLFPHTLSGYVNSWFQKTPKGNLKSWFNMRASFLDRFGKKKD